MFEELTNNELDNIKTKVLSELAFTAEYINNESEQNSSNPRGFVLTTKQKVGENNAGI